MLKDKLGSSEKSQVLGDKSRRVIGVLFKKDIGIFESDISKTKYISDK